MMNIDAQSHLEIENHESSLYEKGKKQWGVLDTIIVEAKRHPLSFTEKGYLDQEWIFNNSERTGLYWGKYLKVHFYLPLQIYLKNLTIYLIEVEHLAYKTVVGAMTNFMTQIVPALEEFGTPVLKATKNSPFLPLGFLEPDDIALILNKIIKVNGQIGEATLRILDIMEKTQKRKGEGFNFFTAGLITPWQNEGTVYSSYLKQMKERYGLVSETRPYPPFTDEIVAQIVEPAMKFLDGICVSPSNKPNKTSIENLQFSKSDLSAPIVSILNAVKEVRKHSTHTQCVKLINRDEKFKKLMAKHESYISELHPVLAANRVNRPDDKQMHGTILKSWFSKLFEITQFAAVWIIALSTGLRNVDLRFLDASTCLHYSNKFKIWYVKADLQKTNNTIYIPIGPPAVKALKLLNWLRTFDSTILIQSRVFLFNDNNDRVKNAYMGGSTLNTKLKRFAEHYGISLTFDNGTEGTCHCIRATLAGYVGRHSVLAVLILKKLFGHSNHLMPDRYLHHNVLVTKFRDEKLDQMHSKFAHEIATSIANKEVAGIKGNELLKGAAHLREKIRLENDSLTEMDVHKKLTDVLKEIILNDIKNEQTQTLLTPMGVICMRATNHSTDSPCSATINKAERDKAGVSRAMFGTLPQLPNPAQCIGLDCPDALATKTHSLPLLEQFDWYTNVYRQCTDENRDIDEDAKHFIDTYYPIVMANDMLTEAESFRKKYSSALRQLYADSKPEGYFGV